MVRLPLAVVLSLEVACSALDSSSTTIGGSWLEISVGSGTFSVLDHGAKGDGKSDDTTAIQAAFGAAAKAKGGTVLFPAGKTYLTTSIHFESSNTVMNVPLGARIVFDKDRSKYDGKHDLINADSLSNIGIIGGGVIDGQGGNWWPLSDREIFRPKTLNVGHCDHLLLMGVTFKDSPAHVLELYSHFTEMSHVRVLNPPSDSDKIAVNGTYGPSHNTDGVDVHGSPFYIHDCHFDTGDDNVAVHASHLLVENCYFGHGHGASIGSCGSDTALENITFRNIVFNHTGAGAKIKTIAGAKKAYVRNVVWENMVHYNVQESIVIDMFYNHGKNKTTDFKISDITIRNLTMHGTKTDAGKTVTPGYFHCQESSRCHDIHLEHITTVDSEIPFDCYNAYGTWEHTSPTPCLMKEKHPSHAPSPHGEQTVII